MIIQVGHLKIVINGDKRNFKALCISFSLFLHYSHIFVVTEVPHFIVIYILFLLFFHRPTTAYICLVWFLFFFYLRFLPWFRLLLLRIFFSCCWRHLAAYRWNICLTCLPSLPTGHKIHFFQDFLLSTNSIYWFYFYYFDLRFLPWFQLLLFRNFLSHCWRQLTANRGNIHLTGLLFLPTDYSPTYPLVFNIFFLVMSGCDLESNMLHKWWRYGCQKRRHCIGYIIFPLSKIGIRYEICFQLIHACLLYVSCPTWLFFVYVVNCNCIY